MSKQASISSFFGASSAVKKAPPSLKSKENVINGMTSELIKDTIQLTDENEKKKIVKAMTKKLKDDIMDTDEEEDKIVLKKPMSMKKNKLELTSNAEVSKRAKVDLLADTDEEDDKEEETEKVMYAIPLKSTDCAKTAKEDEKVAQDLLMDEDESYQHESEEDHDEVDEDEDDDQDISPLTSLKRNNTSKLMLKQATTKKTNSKPNAASVAASIKSDTQLTSGDNAMTSWKDGKPVPYSVLCETLADIEAISSRLEIQSHLTKLFRLCLLKYPKDLTTLVYLSSNTVAAAFECVELGIGDSILIKAIGEASGTNPVIIKKKYESVGDLGTVAMTAKGKQSTLGFGIKPKPLLAHEVLNVLREIANTTGTKSQQWKTAKIKGLLVRVQEKFESKYIIRALQGKLRIGLAQSTVLVSLAHAVLLSGPTKETDEKLDGLTQDAKNVRNNSLPLENRLDAAVNIVKKAYSEVSSFDALVDALVTVPLSRVNKECTLRPGLPVEPMLAKPTKSIQEVLTRLNGKRFTCEFKYDGERAQVHMDSKGITKVFSRSLLDTSEKYPEVPLYVKEACIESGVNSFVLDTEVVAYNRETKQFVPFQILSTRKKTEISDEEAKVKVIVQAFDLMYLNGESLLDRTLSDRRDLLRKHFKVVDGKFQFATALDHTEDGDTAILEEFLDTAVKSQCEGLMVKTLDENATYQPSYRSLNWLKLKKDYLEGMGDSVDLVPIGAYYGRGKRTGVYGAYLLACYDVDTEEYQSVCKIGTGFSDEDLKTLSASLNDHIISEKSSQYNVCSTLECDVWFDACQVWEVKAADLSKSSTHKGAVDKTGETGRGIGLRFPRFERLRNDKRPDQATTSDQILDMYYAQDSIVDTGANDEDDGI